MFGYGNDAITAKCANSTSVEQLLEETNAHEHPGEFTLVGPKLMDHAGVVARAYRDVNHSVAGAAPVGTQENGEAFLASDLQYGVLLKRQSRADANLIVDHRKMCGVVDRDNGLESPRAHQPYLISPKSAHCTITSAVVPS